MKTRIIALLLVACMLFLTLASCGGDETTNTDNGGGNQNGEHVHTFSESWTSNATQHWHKATCEHGEIKDSLGEHKDVNEDGLCDVCDYEVGHEHTFADEWSFDDNYHWKGASCSHKVEQDEIDLHSDDDSNGECDICGGHVHAVGSTGFCKYEGCSKPLEDIDASDFATIITAVTNQGSLVNKVDIVFNQRVSSDNKDYYDGENKSWQSYNISTKHDITVLFGKNGYVNNFTSSQVTTGLGSHESTSNSTFESWYEKDGSSVFGVVSENGGPVVLSAQDPDRLYGNLYTLSTVASGYGTENFLYSIYETAKSSNARDLVANCNEADRKVSFSFNLLVVNKLTGTNVDVSAGGGETGDQVQTGESVTTYNVNYFEVEVSFSYDDMYVITEMEATCKSYTNNAGQLSDRTPNLKDVNIKYYPETGKFDFVKYDETYNPDGDDHYRVVDKSQLTPVSYSYKITQTVGDRTEKNEYPKSSFIPASFDIFTDTELTAKIEGGITVANRNFIYIYIGNCKPEGSSLDFVHDLISYEILDSKGKVIKGTDIMEGNSEVIKASFTLSEKGRYFMIFPMKAGSYTFNINYMGETVYAVPITITN